MRRFINAAGDFLVSRPAWQLRAAFYVLCGLLVYGFLSRTISEARDDGMQTVRDSLSASTSLRLHAKADSAKHRADAAVRAAQDTADKVQRAMDRFAEGLASLPDIELPPVRVAQADSGRDTLEIAGDSLHRYLLPKPIVAWMLTADARVKAQGSVLHIAAQVINVGIPKMRSAYETALAKKDTAILNLDSLATARSAENNALKRQRAASKPSKFRTVLQWGEIAGAAYVGYRVGRGR